MKFFQTQKVDQIGVTAVALQKILLFLMLLSILAIFNGGLLSFTLCLLGFVGAYKRHAGLLRVYFTVSAVLIVLAFILAIVSIGTVNNVASDDSEGMPYQQPNSPLVTSSNAPDGDSSAHAVDSKSSSVEDNGSHINQNSSFIPPTPGSASAYDQDDYTVFIFLAVVVMALTFIIVYLKVYSLILALRLRKMILLAATSLPTESPQVHEFAPANTSCAVANENEATPAPPSPPVVQAPPMFTPGMAPHPYPYPYPMMPMMYPNMPAQQYPHVMHVGGQQPVFYSYGPIPPMMGAKPAPYEKL